MTRTSGFVPLQLEAACLLTALAGISGCALPPHADAGTTGTISGKVTVTEKGAPAKDPSGVVAYLVGYASPPPKTPATLSQQNRQYSPSLLPVVVGQTVSFPNLDYDTSHNAFSLDPRFNLGQYRAGRGAPPTQVFDTPGPVEIYCDIHPDMAATILVLPNASFATTGSSGTFTLPSVAPGTWELFAYDRRALAPAHTRVTVTAGGTATATLAVDRTRFNFDHTTWEGQDYGTRGYTP
ncbi:MAG: hypothetical protein EXR69_05705 [Myxococcales bacterium]|nr:hypothetical protein [Myxococcales bacterium]